MKENVIVLCRTAPNPIWGTQTFFPQHFMFVGLLFYIPEQDETRIGNSEFSTPSGRRNLEEVIIIEVVEVAPLSWPPPHEIQKISKIDHF